MEVTDKLHNKGDDDIDHEKKEDEEVVLPGFRFHPTDEELVGFYLRRKADKKPLRIELIKQIDIYKYDPWDLPKASSVGEKEWYFFCIRGRKYRNSIRPNRVTGSGFWKATGIDKSIYSLKEPHDCIGLKKSLVYYRGSAGKGTKTDWMMHEFRLPPNGPNGKTTNNNLQEPEVWTLCRIFKRVPSFKKYTPNLKDSAMNSSSSNACSLESDNSKPYLTFTNSSSLIQQNQTKPHVVDDRSHYFLGQPPPSFSNYSTFWNHQNVDFGNENWDDLASVVQFAMDPSRVSDDCEEFSTF
ncbi:hypothetical protein Fmac_030706 [Flemingia macrophylla]|uniref:NAC domain-containing protein n=1 Tax=Flemingia macrophylla TaxID=520843 RepID=A0ABD1KZY0_9FABA